MNNWAFSKTMKNVRNYQDIKLVTGGNYLISEPNYYTTKQFSVQVLVVQMSEPKFLMNKQVYLGFKILDFSRIAIHEFWYDYLETYYGSKAQIMKSKGL